jgi:adenine-specific DNA-methyltransferase
MSKLPKLNYIGSKYKLINFIDNTISNFINEPIENKIFGDLFSGTSYVGYFYKQKNNFIISNDTEKYANILSNAYLNSKYDEKIQEKLDFLNLLEPIEGLLYKNYCIDRMYFTKENGKKIDSIRREIEKMKEIGTINLNEYYYLLGCLLIASDKIANIPAVYGCYLKNYKKTALKQLELNPIHFEKKESKNKIYNDDIKNICGNDEYDIVYLDPPYNGRQYSKNYHILNYISDYKDTEIYGKTGLLKNSFTSNFCKKSEIKKDFEYIIENINSKYIFMSYNNEGILTKNYIEKILSNFGTIKTEEIKYKKFKSFKYNTSGETIEYLFCLKKT